ncbi:MAG: LytTR family DNA-binding domain-containing protein [Prevotella sp.]|uniref:LytR/AlgR family response regulator transcription factor n=1 Tax=Prevotella sp. AGR2160 TaxID=1280674 RepID=UPI000416E890|nr:LytTR family DNA-binding domain-containing protein [Prevotella sp. AGR2160]MDD5862662.1 LytTR family DNA-binding domain-containing protein [Prevotella sp.]
MIRCLAIDDEPLALKQLKDFITMVPDLELTAACTSAVDAQQILDHQIVDAIFCDINMPDLNGMDFIKGLSCPPLVVFTTAYSEYALEGYKVDAVDYLLKPFGLDDFRRAAAKLQRRLGERTTDDSGVAGCPAASASDEEIAAGSDVATEAADNRRLSADTDSLFVKVENRMVRVALSSIVYVESMSEYLKLHLDGVDAQGHPLRPVITLYSMKRLEERLPSYFLRIHRSYIINLRYIKEVSKTRVLLRDDVLLPIGELYKEAFNDYLNKNYVGK